MTLSRILGPKASRSNRWPRKPQWDPKGNPFCNWESGDAEGETH